MDLITTSLLILAIISSILIVFASIYNKFQGYIIRINEVEADIDSVLRKRFDLLNRSINIINGNIKVDKEVLELIVKLRSRKLSNFELDRTLYDAINEFNMYKEEYPELNQVESFVKIVAGLNESEMEILALRDYYNDTITAYNKYVLKIPSMIVAKIFKYKLRNFYDGKNMNDEIINDFKL
jgi:LemA protein